MTLKQFNFFLILLFSTVIVSENAFAQQNYLGLSYSASNERGGYKNSFANVDLLILEKSDLFFKYGVEFKIGGSLEKNVNPMLFFAFIPTIQFDIYSIKVEFGTGGMFNHNNQNKVGTHSIATKFIVTPFEISKFSVRFGGYILSNSPINGLGTIGIAYQL